MGGAALWQFVQRWLTVARTQLRPSAVALWSALRQACEKNLAPVDRRPTATSFILSVILQLVSIAILVRVVREHVGPMFRAAPGPAIAAPTTTTRYGLTEEQRRAIFHELYINERAERRRAIEQNTWLGHAWSRDDDLGYVQRTRVRELASQYNVSASQVYLVLEEAIREHWVGPDGQSLPATSAPISLRHE
jgi:hypothetical protein